MNYFRALIGEIKGEDIIDLGDLVKVTHISGREHIGRLNRASKEEIRVGIVDFKNEEVIKLERVELDKK